MKRLPVQNVGKQKVCLFIEPLGEDYWMDPQDTFVVVYTGDDVEDPEFSVATMPDHVIVWINAGDCYSFGIINQATGAEIPCGYNRPDAEGDHTAPA